MRTYTQKEIDDVMKKLIKGVDKGKPENPYEVVKGCTENGNHLKEVDDDGFCCDCGYQESINDFKK
jgi:hypothetical protein